MMTFWMPWFVASLSLHLPNLLSLLLFIYFVDCVVGNDVDEEGFIPKAIIVGCNGDKDVNSNNVDNYDDNDAANGEAGTASAASHPPLLKTIFDCEKWVESLTGHVCTAMIVVQMCAFIKGNTSSLTLPKFPLFTSVNKRIYTQGRQNRNMTCLRGQCHNQTVLRVVRRGLLGPWSHWGGKTERVPLLYPRNLTLFLQWVLELPLSQQSFERTGNVEGTQVGWWHFVSQHWGSVILSLIMMWPMRGLLTDVSIADFIHSSSLSFTLAQ